MLLEKDNYCLSEQNENVIIAVYSSIGNRDEQQDCAGYSLGKNSAIVVLCDGMGGHAAGKIASNKAVSGMLDMGDISMLGSNVHDELCKAAKELDNAVHLISDEDGNWLKAGTTFITTVIMGLKMYWVSVGDSRIYLHRGDRLIQLNQDHTYQNALDNMLRQNSISQEEYDKEIEKGEALISFLGIGDLSIIDGNNDSMYLESGDKILIMSDGLYKIIPDNEVCSIISNFSNLEDALRTLDLKVKAKAKKENIVRDNMTLALIKVK